MTDQTRTEFYIPQNMGRIILRALEEIIGHNGVNAILNQARLSHWIDNYPPNTPDLLFRFGELSAIQLALEQIYGTRGGRGVALRSGRVCFRYGLREFGPNSSSNQVDFRLAPIESKINTGVHILSQFFNQTSDQRISIETTPKGWFWINERCPICWGRITDASVCHIMVGVLQEGLYWLSGGKFINVEEVSCTAKGDPYCSILIDKRVIE